MNPTGKEFDSEDSAVLALIKERSKWLHNCTKNFEYDYYVWKIKIGFEVFNDFLNLGKNAVYIQSTYLSCL